MARTVFTGAALQDVVTPTWLLQVIQDVYRPEVPVDICPLHHTEDFFQKPLDQYPAVAYCNPPYNNIEPWITRALQAWEQYGRRTCFLVPARTNQEWFMRVYSRVDEVECVFIHNEVRFQGHTGKLPGALVLLFVGQAQPRRPRFCYRPLDVARLREPTRHWTRDTALAAGYGGLLTQ
jgi:hypothetical protein